MQLIYISKLFKSSFHFVSLPQATTFSDIPLNISEYELVYIIAFSKSIYSKDEQPLNIVIIFETFEITK